MPHAILASMSSESWDTAIQVPASTRFPVELVVPPGFEVDDPATWPRVEGRLEYVDGRLLWMPPCALSQQLVAVSAVRAVANWGDQHRDFLVGGNEAGLIVGKDARGAEAAVWRREALLGADRKKFVRVPPILAVEVEGNEEGERELRAKAAWYLARGVQVVWVVLAATRDVLVVDHRGETRCCTGEHLPPHAELPGLTPLVDDFFAQLD